LLLVLDKSLENGLLERRFEGEFIPPAYDDFCLSNVPSLITSLLGQKSEKPTVLQEYFSKSVALESAQNIILMVLDGFGFDAWLRRASDGGFFQIVTERGVVIPITTVFPSTTAAALTTISTGLTPQEHGLPEWFVYMKELDMIVATLRFSPMGVNRRDALFPKTNPSILLSANTIHTRLRKAGVTSLSLLPTSAASGAYAKVSLKGSEIVRYRTLAQYALSLRKRLNNPQTKTFVYAYWDTIDTAAHVYGPNAEETDAETSALSQVLKTEFLGKLEKEAARNTVLIVTADHGQVSVTPKETIYLNKYPKVVSAFATSERKRRILPSWGPRDVALHIDASRLEATKSELRRLLGDRSVILETREAIRMGLFGTNRVSRRFTRRAGDLLVLQHGSNLVWYEHPNEEKFGLMGMHGGLTKNEMLIPLAAARLSDLLQA
jgi:hypothetical protein